MLLSGWGRYPIAECTLLRAVDANDVPGLLKVPSVIARGNGRSYGDASLNRHATIDTLRLDHLITFEASTGHLVCEGGLLLAALIDAMLPRGWFPPVTPGTKLVTIAGMIASDVHGKNHHGAGSFCDHVEWLDLAIGEGQVLRCSATENSDLFAATCGGMGLTGVILRACVRLLRVESAAIRQRTLLASNLEHALNLIEGSLRWTYSVAWVDCLASGKELGRSAVFLGEHALIEELSAARRTSPLSRRIKAARRIPVDFPTFALSRTTVRLFNRTYYAAQCRGDTIVDMDRYFYPLDTVLDWNRIYGRHGFVQYQCVLPLHASAAGLTALLKVIAAAGEASFLAVLKRMGPKSFGMLSFPMEGYTLALDFPANPSNLALLEQLDAITVDHGGSIYLAKDARVSPATFAAGSPRLDEFRAVRRRYGLDKRFSSLLSERLELA